MKTRKWTDDKGNERYSTEINCNDFTFLSTKKESSNNAQNSPAPQSPAAPKQQLVSTPAADDNDDLPF